MGLKRLAKDGKSEGGSGYLSEASDTSASGEAPEQLDRPAIILHVGKFKSMDGEVAFDDKRLKAAVETNNARIKTLAEAYGGEDKIPPGEYPRVMEDHEGENPSRATIGRMMGPYSIVKTDIPKLGLKGVTAILCERVRYLGKENTSRARDGRLHDLSLGINEKQGDIFDELSHVGEGAAPGARLLSRGKQDKGDSMATKVKKTGEGKKRLAKLVEAHTNLTRFRGDLEAASTKLAATSGKIRLATRRAKVDGELRGLIRLGKMTPAEYKNLKIDEIASLDDATQKVCLSAFTSREKPVIDPTQRGSSDAVEAGQLAKDIGKKRLRAEAREDMKRLGVKLKADAEEEHKEDKAALAGEKPPGEKKEMGADGDGNGEESAMLGEYRKHMGDLKKHLDSGNMDEAKKCFELAHKMGLGDKHLAYGDEGEGSASRLSEMQEQIDSVSTLVSKLAGEVDKIMAVEKEEGHEELEAGEPGKEEKPGEDGAA